MTSRSLLKALRSSLLLPVAFIALAAAPAPPADAKTEPTLNLKLLSKGAVAKLHGYTPHLLKMSERKPAGLKNAPHLISPLYGEIPFGGKTYFVAVDEPEGHEFKLYFDSNGSGDLTDDPEVTWDKKPYKGPNDLALGQYLGEIKVPLKVAGKSEPVTLVAYRFDKNDPQRQVLKDVLLYY